MTDTATCRKESELSNEEIVTAVKLLGSPAYSGLSRTHTDSLIDMEFEAKRRGLKLTS